MQDDAAHPEHPPFMERCERMSFAELRKFIDDALEGLPDPGPATEFPRSKEEFLKLRDLLYRKLEEMKDGAPEPLPPRPKNPGYMSLFFDPSEQLSSAYDRQDRFLQILEDAPYDPSTSQRYVEQVRGQLRAVEREIAERESVEEQEHERRLSEHRKSELEYSRSVRLWNQKAKQAQQWRESMARRSQIVQGVSRRIEHAFKLGAVAPTSRIQWQPLSPHQATPERIRGHYHKRLQREGRLDKFDQTRLDAATALPYEEWWVPTEGFGGFDAYSIISFSHTNKVLLECPIYGNAAYVIDANEEVWREMKKHELIESGLAEKIPHQGENWPAKIRQALDLE